MQSAATLRKQEQEAKKQAIEAQKERRKRRQPEQEAAAAEDEEDEAPPTEVDEEEEVVGEEDIDMLPDDVIYAIAGDETQDRRIMERRVMSEQLRLQRQPKQRRVFSERQVGPVTVKVLKKTANRKASGEKNLIRIHGFPLAVLQILN